MCTGLTLNIRIWNTSFSWSFVQSCKNALFVFVFIHIPGATFTLLEWSSAIQHLHSLSNKSLETLHSILLYLFSYITCGPGDMLYVQITSTAFFSRSSMQPFKIISSSPDCMQFFMYFYIHIATGWGHMIPNGVISLYQLKAFFN